MTMGWNIPMIRKVAKPTIIPSKFISIISNGHKYTSFVKILKEVIRLIA